MDMQIFREIDGLLETNPEAGRDKLIRLLEDGYSESYGLIINSLLEKSGLFQYVDLSHVKNIRERLLIELHRPLGMDNIVLHKVQGEIYRQLLDGENIILSAPTSFGKSLLIDTIIASMKYKNIVVIVPSIALIEETRKRLIKNFNRQYKIITFPNQERAEKNVFVLTQERFIELDQSVPIDFFVIDEFYKLSITRGDSRAFTLNDAFYRLIKKNIHFLMIGPNIDAVDVGKSDIKFSFIRTNFMTVSANIQYLGVAGVPKNVPQLCKKLDDSTLIFCKSSNSAYSLGNEIATEIQLLMPTNELNNFISWLKLEYHKDWSFVKLLEHGIGVHHSGLPRAVSQFVLYLFNKKHIKYLLCTNTIIEGVNTSAKNIIIYDNKIATKKYDYFTFNNIRGRAGRMFEHFVGNIFINQEAPQLELPIIDIPILGDQDAMNETMLLKLDQKELSDESVEKLKYLHAQNYLPLEIIRANSEISPINQINCAIEIENNLSEYSKNLSWTELPTKESIDIMSSLIFTILMHGHKDNLITSEKQLSYKLKALQFSGSYKDFISAEVSSTFYKSLDDRIENALKFVRNWCDYTMPKYLTALESIQAYVFEKHQIKRGYYSTYLTKIRSYFDKYGSSILEEMGIPLQVASKVEMGISEKTKIDDILEKIWVLNENDRTLHPFESHTIRIAKETIG